MKPMKLVAQLSVTTFALVMVLLAVIGLPYIGVSIPMVAKVSKKSIVINRIVYEVLVFATLAAVILGGFISIMELSKPKKDTRKLA